MRTIYYLFLIRQLMKILINSQINNEEWIKSLSLKQDIRYNRVNQIRKYNNNFMILKNYRIFGR